MQELIKLLNQLSGTKVTLACAIIILGFVGLKLLDRWLKGHLEKVAQKWSPNTREYIRKGVETVLASTIMLLTFHLLGVDLAGSVMVLALVLVIILNVGKTLVTNWTAGFYVLSSKRFKVGEHIIVNGSEGTVKSIGINATVIETKEGMRVCIPNSAIAYSSFSIIDPDDLYRMQMKIAFSNMYTPDQAVAMLKSAIAAIPTVVRKESISVGISSTVVMMTAKPIGIPSLDRGCMEYQCSFYCCYKDRAETTFAFNKAIALLYAESVPEQEPRA